MTANTQLSPKTMMSIIADYLDFLSTDEIRTVRENLDKVLYRKSHNEFFQQSITESPCFCKIINQYVFRDRPGAKFFPYSEEKTTDVEMSAFLNHPSMIVVNKPEDVDFLSDLFGLGENTVEVSLKVNPERHKIAISTITAHSSEWREIKHIDFKID